MKKIIVLVFALLIYGSSSFAQPGKKPPQKDKPPTQKEMADMMKEMQKELDGMSPEDKKMMDSMGVKMPDVKSIQKNVSGISDAQLKKAFEDENRIVPIKDVSRINEVLATTLNTQSIGSFINKTHQFVISKLSVEAKSKGEELLREMIKQNFSIANTAAGLWIDGKPALALYLMGEACKADPSNTNNLNNYASFLTMCGAEQMALPILNNLNKRYPQNSTVLNNIAQAWLGLGDIQRAEKYADSTILLYAYHPQANMAKCLIEESKGNFAAAIAAAKKSIREAYSIEKENKLKKLGYDLKSEDLNWDPPLDRDPIGLEKFTWPEYPLDVEQNKLAELEWADFKDNCQQKINELKIKQATAEKNYQEISVLRTQQVLQAGQNGQYVQLIPGYAAKAIKKLGPTVNDVDGNMSFVFAQALEPVLKAIKKGHELQTLLSEKQELLDKKYEDKIGEGKENPLEQICKDENAIRTEFLKDANGGLQSAYRQYLNYASRRTSDLLYYYQYTSWPEQFELVKINAQIAWLTTLRDQNPFFQKKSSWCINVPKTKSFDSLQNFDDVACKYVSTLNLGVYKITSSCSNLVGEFDLKGIKINIKDNVETGNYTATAIVGVSQSVGPTALKLKGTIGGLIEISNNHITDIGAVAGVAVKSGPVTIIGGNVQATFNTGFTTSGKFLGQKK
jgi:hypothetical protein